MPPGNRTVEVLGRTMSGRGTSSCRRAVTSQKGQSDASQGPAPGCGNRPRRRGDMVSESLSQAVCHATTGSALTGRPNRVSARSNPTRSPTRQRATPNVICPRSHASESHGPATPIPSVARRPPSIGRARGVASTNATRATAAASPSTTTGRRTRRPKPPPGSGHRAARDQFEAPACPVARVRPLMVSHTTRLAQWILVERSRSRSGTAIDRHHATVPRDIMQRSCICKMNALLP